MAPNRVARLGLLLLLPALVVFGLRGLGVRVDARILALVGALSFLGLVAMLLAASSRPSPAFAVALLAAVALLVAHGYRFPEPGESAFVYGAQAVLIGLFSTRVAIRVWLAVAALAAATGVVWFAAFSLAACAWWVRARLGRAFA
ncbi:MAG: hypothetical protein ACYDCK_07960 [Thermoplasmatota archaeon]